MPLAGEKRRVTGVLQRLGERDFLQRQPIAVSRGKQLRVAAPLVRRGRADVIGDAGPLRPLARHDAGACRRANRASGIGVGESRAVAGQAVQVRRLVEGAAVAPEVALPQVVGEKEQHVGAFRGRLTQQVLGDPIRRLTELAALEDLLDAFQRHVARRPHKVQSIQGGQDFVFHGAIEHRGECVQGRHRFRPDNPTPRQPPRGRRPSRLSTAPSAWLWPQRPGPGAPGSRPLPSTG